MTTDNDPPITHWLALLKAGDPTAAQPLWDHYFQRLVYLVHACLPTTRVIDGEGLAASAFRSLWLGVTQGRFPQLDDRNDFWRLLVTIARRKIADELAKANTLKRGGALKRAPEALVEELLSREPTPEMAALVADQFAYLLNLLDNDEYRQIALWKMEGLTNEDISEHLGCSIRTITNRLDVIRHIWLAEQP